MRLHTSFGACVCACGFIELTQSVCAQSGLGLCIKIFIFLEESFDAEKDTRKTMLESQEDFFPILYVAQIYNEGSKYQIIIKIAFVFSLPY